MCGILGVYKFKESQFNQTTKGHLQTLYHRGPDSQDYYKNQHLFLGHTRLAILDLQSRSNQPMTSHCDNYIIVFNGEIYNFKSLRNQLNEKGYQFKSESDTEVLLNLYIEYGEKCLSFLNGFFSFAIYSKLDRSLFLARDRFGIKPLVYSIDEDGIYFSSEIKAITPVVKNLEIDKEAISLYFQYTFIPAPKTIYKNIKKLIPGHFIKVNFDDQSIEEKQYYSIPEPAEKYTNKPILEIQQNIRGLLESSICDRLVSDAPLGAFLSGGIDSSIIVALASKHVPNLKTFSIGFEDPTIHDETYYSDLVAKKFQTNHKTIRLSEKDYLDSAIKILNHLDEPFADSSSIAVNILCKNVSSEVKVALSGDGADEVFAGYNRYKAETLLRSNQIVRNLLKSGAPFLNMLPQSRDFKFSNIFRQLSKLSSAAKKSEIERYYHWCSFTQQNKLKDLIIDFQNADINSLYRLERNKLKKDFNWILNNDLKFILPNDMLFKVDSMSMANSLEVRVPFLDHRIIENAFQIPANLKIDQSTGKKIIQDTFRDVLPKEIYHRPKQGFSVPLLKWFQSDLKNLIFDELLDDQFILEQGIFNLKTIKQLKNELVTGKRNDSESLIWSLVVFQSWYKNNIK